MTSDHHREHGDNAFDGRWWEEHYQHVGAEPIGRPSAHLLAELAGITPGTALDAGCGTGADAAWLARQGWQVTALDISPTAVQHARTLVAAQQPDVSTRISWLVADLTVWRPPRRFDLVVSLYVHPVVPFGDFVARLADAVAPGGTLLVIGHDPADSHSAAHAPRTASIDSTMVVPALGPGGWDVAVAEIRTRQASHGSTQLMMSDLVVKARRSAAG